MKNKKNERTKKTDVMLRIVGSHVFSGGEEDQMELMTEGELYKNGETIYLTYEESEFTGMEGCKTELILDGNIVKMSRNGEGIGIESEIKFEKGKRHAAFYDTPYGPIEMEVLANDVHNSITGEGLGDLEIDYSISLKGISEGRSKLNIKVDKRAE